MSINDYDDVDESIECQLMMVMFIVITNIMNHYHDKNLIIRLKAALCSSNFQLLYKLHTTKQVGNDHHRMLSGWFLSYILSNISQLLYKLHTTKQVGNNHHRQSDLDDFCLPGQI